jgi:hypothetical protein
MLLTLEVSARFTLEVERVEVSSAGFKRRAPLVDSVFSQLGDEITVHVTTSDAEGLPIYIRDGFLKIRPVAYFTSKPLIFLWQSKAQPEVHEGVLPREWFVSAGQYDLILSSTLNTSQMVRISVELESPWTYLLIAGAVGLGTMVVFLGVLVTLLVLNPHKTIDEIKLLVKSFVVFEMKIWFICTAEQIDIVLDTLNLLAVTRDGEAQHLKFAYTVLFGCSSVASVCMVIAFLRLLVIRLRMRFTTYALDLYLLGGVMVSSS